ncbi:MAG: tellurium resistance protein TerC [Frankiales bacterium]|nr:tellurium resistance protein TerC [Frankiales bacterium]
MLDVPVWVWAATLLGLLAILVFDLLLARRSVHEPSTRSAAGGVLLYVGLAGVFALGLLLFGSHAAAGQFVTGYVLEYSLSVDNLFVYLLLMGSFLVPEAQRRDVLLVGIVGTLLLRGPFIVAGAAAAERFSATFYVFGALLLYTAFTLVRGSDEHKDPGDNVVVRVAQRFLPITDTYSGSKVFVTEDGRRVATPLLLAMIAVSVTGLVFALDSIPAIFGVTKDPYVIVAANAFALMGLRQLYFLVGGLVKRLVHLSVGLAVILGFIGVKLVLEAAHGDGFDAIPVPGIGLSLGVIVVVLAVTTATSLRASRAA